MGVGGGTRGGGGGWSAAAVVMVGEEGRQRQRGSPVETMKDVSQRHTCLRSERKGGHVGLIWRQTSTNLSLRVLVASFGISPARCSSSSSSSLFSLPVANHEVTHDNESSASSQVRRLSSSLQPHRGGGIVTRSSVPLVAGRRFKCRSNNLRPPPFFLRLFFFFFVCHLWQSRH